MIFQHLRSLSSELLASQLFSERTFYPAFLSDMRSCKDEVIIECPFIASRRINKLLPAFRDLRRRGVKFTINIREPQEHDERMRREAELTTTLLQDLGVQVLFTGGHHRKLVIIDRKILYEGSLNVLSQNESCEVMRRIESERLAKQMIDFIKVNQFLDRGF